MERPPVDRVAFVLSLVVLAWLYGFATSARGWFPNDLLVRAWDQARSVLDPRPDWIVRRVYDREGVRILDPERIQPGLTLIATDDEGAGWSPGLQLIDREGRVRHRWPLDSAALFPGASNLRPAANVHGAFLFPDGDLVVNASYVGAARVDACGRVRWRLTEGNHHSVARGDDGTFWIPAVSEKGPAVTPEHPDGLPGITGEVFRDRILQVSADGEILRDIDVFDVLYANGLERYIRKASWKSRQGDVTHLNDVEPLPEAMAGEYPLFDAGDLVVSLRHLDLVFVLDPVSGRVKWHASDPFLQQHDPDFIGGGWIGVFDNNHDGTDRGTMLGGSRIVAVQPHTDSVRILFPTEASEPFYTETAGQWQLLANGDLLLTETQAARVVEVAPDGRTVWDWVASPREEGSVPEVTSATRYDLTPEAVATWSCPP